MCKNKEDGFQAAKALLRLGSQVNMAASGRNKEKAKRSLFTSARFHTQNTESNINSIPFDAANIVFDCLRPNPEFSLKEQKGQQRVIKKNKPNTINEITANLV